MVFMSWDMGYLKGKLGGASTQIECAGVSSGTDTEAAGLPGQAASDLGYPQFPKAAL